MCENCAVEARAVRPIDAQADGTYELARLDVRHAGSTFKDCLFLVDRKGLLTVIPHSSRVMRGDNRVKAVAWSRPLRRRIVEAAAEAYREATGTELAPGSRPPGDGEGGGGNDPGHRRQLIED